jgi:hypothetical protein
MNTRPQAVSWQDSVPAMIHAIEYGSIEMPPIPSFAALSWLMASLIYLCRTRDLLLTRLLSGASIPEEPYEA